MSATLRDIADAAGVSVMSACAVLTGGGQNVRVSEEKAIRIREKARELHYEPNALGRGLKTRKTETIGVVLQHLSTFGDEPYYYQQLFDGFMLALFPRGYTLALSPTLVQSNGRVRVANGRFDGVLWCCPDLIETSIDSAKSLKIPIAMVHAPPEVSRGLPTFAADNEGAMDRVVEHLVELGHREIGFVLKPHVSLSAEGKARSAAFLNAARRRGVKADVLLWEYEAELTQYVGPNRPHTALAAFNDVHAGHLLARAAEVGIQVPSQLSVVGFDSSSFCERTLPKLTSVHQPIQRIAQDAAECLLRMIQAGQEGVSPADHPSRLYDCRLDVRESTASPQPHRRGI